MLNPLTRSLLTVLRGIPELVWARLFVRVFGLGPAAGVLAKVYAEILESVDTAASVVMGFVGAGGLGQLLYFELSLFHHAQASTVIVAMLLLSITVDQGSALLRQRLS